jgi:hypothetical protein
MNRALNLIYDTLDVFSGKKPSLKEKKPGLVDLMDTARNREKARICRKNCRYPAWAGACPYLHVNPETCAYNGANDKEESDE